MTDPNANATMYQLSKDSNFHFGILRALAMATYDGADIDECLVAANSIVPGDFESFSKSFLAIANNVYRRALGIAKTRFPVSARIAFFSAATYFRSADFHLHGNPADARIMDYWAKQTDAFDQGLALLSPPGTRLNIKTLDFDIFPEEMFHVAGLAALERGYNVAHIRRSRTTLTTSPSGQRLHRRLGKGSSPPSWTYVLDKTNDVDPEAVALYGLSLGVMAMDGVWDFGAVVRHGFGPDAMRIHDSGDKAKFDALAQRYLRPGTPTSIRWGLEHGMWAFNTGSPLDFVTEVQKFTLEGVTRYIRTPVLIGDAHDDMFFFTGQARQLAEAIGKWATLYYFKNQDSIGTHAFGDWGVEAAQPGDL
ncbi:2,6-dihydropseudooxynicotine hydrolase [Metarhizium rileyi]|uniref:2,6-dihydropseudooxynicotine hydrolase n=1 Tax=Metarhizium rileyi (strain RCEF 4871) TaxID=1649241 RepID=A0A162J3Y2_METRR|nr:2,6-dihydropseudooxynicotine hydrolase [Metarhizium rileyi RCEF 4871]